MYRRLSLWHAYRIDPEDADTVDLYRWYAVTNRENGNVYARARALYPGRPGRRPLYMHRLITNCPPGLVVDHINGDTLDNRRCNLRVTTTRLNAMNHDSHGDGLVPFRGVSFSGKHTYRARIVIEGKDTRLGTFPTAEEAARAYDEKAKELYGPFAWCNFPTWSAPPTAAEDAIPF